MTGAGDVLYVVMIVASLIAGAAWVVETGLRWYQRRLKRRLRQQGWLATDRLDRAGRRNPTLPPMDPWR